MAGLCDSRRRERETDLGLATPDFLDLPAMFSGDLDSRHGPEMPSMWAEGRDVKRKQGKSVMAGIMGRHSERE